MVERLEVLKFICDEDFYILIIPNGEIREFRLFHKDFGDSLYMFGCKVGNDDEAIELAIANYHQYIESYIEYFFTLEGDDDDI